MEVRKRILFFNEKKSETALNICHGHDFQTTYVILFVLYGTKHFKKINWNASVNTRPPSAGSSFLVAARKTWTQKAPYVRRSCREPSLLVTNQF